jgi:pyruvate dehydrogenase (quinone)
MNEMITIKRYRDRLTSQNPTLVFCIFNNQDLNQVTWEQRAESGDPKYPGTQYIPDVPYARYAELLGLTGIFCDDPAHVGDAWDAALAADRPTLLDVRCDPDVPPIPPRATFAQARSTASAILHGDEDAAGFVKQGIKQKVQQYLPGTKDGD